MAQTKKIVAIMFTSLVNYAKLTKQDSKLALELLGEHDKILSKVLDKYQGRIIKHINDSIFAEFASATDSVNCSIAIQKEIKKANDINPKDFQMSVGIGLHMAEVYEEDGDLFGDGINLAARIKSVASSHEIFTTQAIYNSIRSEKHISVRDIGRVVLKNIQDPERIFKIYTNKIDFNSETLDSIITNMKARGVKFFDYKQSKSSQLSVGMHYIHNLGGPDDEFLCFGITDSINSELGKIKPIKTPKINDIIKIKDLEDITQISDTLNVDYLIQGSLMQINKQIRLSIQMHNTINSKELWTEHWDSSSDKLENIKNEVIAKILESLGIDIPNKFQTTGTKNKIDPEAYKYMMQGKYTSHKAQNATDLELARTFYKKAFECQPSYILPKVIYAKHSFELRKYEEGLIMLQEAEEEGIKNKDYRDLVQVYFHFGIVYKQMGKYDKSIDYLKNGLRMLSSDDTSRTESEQLNLEAVILNTIGQCYTQTSRITKSIDCFKRAINTWRTLDKHISIAAALGNLALAHKKIGDYAKALTLNKEVIKIYKDNNLKTSLGIAILNYANLLYYIGYTDKAKTYYLEALELGKEFNTLPLIGMIYRSLGLLELNKNNANKAIEYLTKANQIHKDAKHQIAIETTTTLLAQAYEQNEDFENAAKYITRAVMLTNRRKHEDTTNSYSEYYTLPSRCVKALIDTQITKDTKKDLDQLLDEIITLHADKPKGRELWWLAKAYFILGLEEEAEKCQKLSQKDITKKAGLIRDKIIRNDYLTLPPLHQQIFAPIEEINSKINIKDQPKPSTKSKDNENTIFKFCPSCGFNNENSFKFCPSCGSPLTQ